MKILSQHFQFLLIIPMYFIVSCFYLYAQNEHLINYGLQDGLPQSQVYDVVQDHIGFLWLGTQGGGLARFDGLDFQVYKESQGLLSNFIHVLHPKGDTLFIGTNEGLSIKIKNQFTNFPSPYINKIIPLHSKIYCATQKGIWEYANGNLQLSTDFSAFKSMDVRDIHFDGTGYWVASRYGLWYYKNLEEKPEQISRNDFMAITASDSLVLAGSFVSGIFIFKNGEPKDTITNVNRLYDLMIKDSDLWVSTSTEGISIYDLETLEIKKFINKKSGLKNSLNVKKCFQDQQANIWIATSGGGLYKYAPTNFTHYTTNAGLLGNRVYALAESGPAIIASNSENGLVQITEKKVEKVEDFGFLDAKVKAVAVQENGTIWAGTNGKGILVIRKEEVQDTVFQDSLNYQILTDTITLTDTISTQNSLLPADWIRKILLYGNRAWVATYSSGLIRLHIGKNGQYGMRIYNRRRGLNDVYLNDIARDSLGKIWYATKNGALGYVWDGEVQHFPNVLNTRVSIGTILIREGKMFLGTLGEGIWWAEQKEPLNFQPLIGEKQLFSNNIYQLIFDDKGYLWAGSEKGVDRILLNEAMQIVDVFHYAANDGFLGIETCMNAVQKDSEGNIWFGTMNGLTKYQALEQEQKTLKPVVHFGDLELVYQKVDSFDFRQFEKQAFQIEPDKKHLSVTFRTVDLNHPKAIEYRWRLNNGNWSNWGRENKVNFANLDYGNYTFQAQSRNIDWKESEAKQFRFEVLTPWYLQRRFQIPFLILLLALIAGLIYRHIHQLKAKSKAAIEKLELKNHLLSLEQKALQLQMNPHFIFNVLNGIKAMGLRGETSSMNETINTFATLLRGILNNSRQENISLSKEIQTLESYVQLEQKIQIKPFDFNIETHLEFDAEEIMIPPMLVQPFVENSIRHGLSPLKRAGLLKIIFSTKDNCLHCEIIDNGIGFEQSQKNKSLKSHPSMALQVTKERIASLSGTPSFSIEEVVEEDRVKGTKVWFKIPLLVDF